MGSIDEYIDGVRMRVAHHKVYCTERRPNLSRPSLYRRLASASLHHNDMAGQV